jgi:4-hydroxy-3-methylbut-2-enyl diphosphate reductase
MVCDYIRSGGDREAFLAKFRDASSPGFDPDVDLCHIGLANQTTMLMTESLEIGDMFRDAIRERYGDADLVSRYRAFDTICSATQDRQDAVNQLLAAEPLDLMLVVGGYNSSNTCNLAHICAEHVPTFHIADPTCLESPTRLRHKPVGAKEEVEAIDWLPSHGPLRVGLTSGASTPDNLVEQVIRQLSEFANTN